MKVLHFTIESCQNSSYLNKQSLIFLDVTSKRDGKNYSLVLRIEVFGLHTEWYEY